jgi:hypothetical protein
MPLSSHRPLLYQITVPFQTSRVWAHSKAPNRGIASQPGEGKTRIEEEEEEEKGDNKND